MSIGGNDPEFGDAMIDADRVGRREVLYMIFDAIWMKYNFSFNAMTMDYTLVAAILATDIYVAVMAVCRSWPRTHELQEWMLRQGNDSSISARPCPFRSAIRS